MTWLKRVIRRWLGITDPDVFMGVDLGWNEYSAVVVMKRIGGGKTAVVDVHNFAPHTDFEVVRRMCGALADKYGVKPENVVEDRPRSVPPLT